MRQKARKGSLNHHLRDERLNHHWSQKEVADRIGTTTNNVSRWELGITSPGPHFQAKLCELFGKQPQELGLLARQTGEEPRPTSTPILNGLKPPLPVVDRPEPIWHVPYQRNPFFTGREGLLRHLHDMLHRGHTMALTQSLAISGLGGIGKTQVALEYAYQYRANYASVFWTSAATREALLTGFMTLAHLLQLPEKDEHDHNRVLTAVKHWLATHQEWLLILDNTDDITVLHDMLPTERSGHLLLTSRAQAWGSLAQCIEVETMGMAEGALFLLHRAKCLAPDAFLDQASQELLAGAEAIVIEMDFLPLALDQAGAYIEEVGCNLATYLELYCTHRQDLLRRRGHVPSDHPASVATTWSLNFQYIEQTNPAAADLMRLYAFLEPDTIPEELISNGGAALGLVFQALTTDALRMNEAIEVLRTFSLIQRDAETGMLRIHRLVQAVLRDAIEPEEQCQWAERAVRATNTVFPESVEVTTWSRCRRYLSQAQACSILIQEYGFQFAEASSLLSRTADYLYDQALYERADPLYQLALNICEQTLGPEHPDVAYALNKLVKLFYQQEKFEQAEPFCQRALHIREQMLGPNHSDIADSLNELARIYVRQGKYAQAELCQQRALHICEYIWGPDHPDVATSLNTQARIFLRQGKYQEAELLSQRALHIWEQALGPEHPNVARTLNVLGNIYDEQSREREAEPLYQQALRVWEQALGPNHPDVAIPLNNLGNIYARQGKHREAELFFRRSLRIWEQTLGPDHSNVAGTLHNLADLCAQQGKHEEAEQFYQQSLRIWEQALGRDHPNAAYPLHGLANLYHTQGRNQQAASLYQRALDIRERTHKEHHPEIAETLHDFAVFQEAQGRHQEAAVMYQRALAIREQVLGPHQKGTVETRIKYLTLLRLLGREAEAERIEMDQPE